MFFIDGMGALVSAIMLGLVLPSLHQAIGMPLNALYLLAAIPCVFALYDGYCYFFTNVNTKIYLHLIAFANTCYCVLSGWFIVQHYSVLTNLGLAYFVAEIMILIVLVSVELRVAYSISSSNN